MIDLFKFITHLKGMGRGSRVVTRFAPSPTGMLHIGGLRTALYSYLVAKQNNGKFILRIEDTDQSRFVVGATEDIINTLTELSLQPDNLSNLYYQSKNIQKYQNYAERLIKQNKAYYCFCSAERLANLRKEQIVKKQAPGYDGHCRNLDQKTIDNYKRLNKPRVIRFKTPRQEEIKFSDVVRGEISIKTDNIDDQVLIKSDGFPTYHLAVIIDDHQMGVTHIIRGEEWLPSTPKHVLLYQAFDWDLPKYIHLPLLLNKDRSKLSKRSNDVAAHDYLQKGYLPEAMINFMVLLGWNPGDDRELFTLDQLINEFKLEKINKSGAIFDLDKLNWFGQQYFQKMSTDEFYQSARAWLSKYDEKIVHHFNKNVAAACQTRISHFAEIKTAFSHLFNDIELDPKSLIFKKSTQELTLQGLSEVMKDLKNINENSWNADNLQLHLASLVRKLNLGNGDVFWPVRYALSGKEKSETPVELLMELGKEKSLARIDKAITYLKKS
ncbi:MAG: glutamate--tRNA ligase [Candidatus Komeilibacteria bacterium]